jgi:SNF2 family DNA or RNA helicase
VTVEIRIRNRQLVVCFGEDDRALLAVAASLLGPILGGSRSGAEFVFGPEIDQPSTCEKIIQFLGSRGVAPVLDDGARGLLQSIEQTRQTYAEARAVGSRVRGLTNEELQDIKGDFKRALTDKQQESVAHLIDAGHGADFSVPGAGKTTICLAYFALLRSQDVIDRLLVVCPRSAFMPWEDEFEACFQRRPRSVRLSGSPEERARIYRSPEGIELFLATYQMALNDIEALKGLCRRCPTLVVLDESHHVKRITEGQWAEAVLALAPLAVRRVILTGTPMPQGYEDLWTQFTYLWPTQSVFGDRNVYRHQCERREWDWARDQVRPLFRRIRKSDLNLPAPQTSKVGVGLADQQARLYKLIGERALASLDMPPTERWMLREWRRAKLVRLMQVSSNPSLLSDYSEEFQVPPLDATDVPLLDLVARYPDFEVPAKFEKARALVSTLVEAGEKVLVWTWFVKNVRMLQRFLGDLAPVFLVYGAVPKDASEDEEFNREQQIRQFKDTQGPAILVANPAACGESVSLHKVCGHAIYVDRTFDCAKFMQSQDRIHRFGLGPDDEVHYHILIAEGTVDEVIDRRLEVKRARMLDLLEGELPVGSLEEWEEEESEELTDFEQAMEQLRTNLAARKV